MNIRQATTSDVPQLVTLNRGAEVLHANAMPGRFRRNVPEDTVAQAFSSMIEAPSSYWLVAEEEQPVAFLSAEFRDREESWCLVAHRACYLAGIIVAPDHRRRGIARALFAELRREAAARGATCIELDVWSFNNEARRVFANLGFQSLMEKMALPV
jgi:ribosomal protein S18 acetylase RimI-like enzyme